MKDDFDKKTGDLLAPARSGRSGAERQAEFKARKLADGYRRATVWIHQDSWQAGHDAGRARKPSMPVPAGMDGLSWFSGYIEGKTEGRA